MNVKCNHLHYVEVFPCVVMISDLLFSSKCAALLAMLLAFPHIEDKDGLVGQWTKVRDLLLVSFIDSELVI